MILREATYADKDILLKWRNAEPELGNGQTVMKKEHDAWFKWAMVSPDHLIYIIRPEVGYMRFRKASKKVYASIYIKPEYRGQGIGTKVIKEGTQNCMDKWEVERVLAEVRNDNRPSQVAFKRSGYECFSYGGGCMTYEYTGRSSH